MQNGNDVYEYSYDAVGNITQIKKNGTVYESYTYDALGQLTTVTRGNDVYTYTYGNGGNIQSVTKNGQTHKNYTYGDSEWRDLLTAFNGDTITYDEIGNPLQYRDGFEFTWSNGRQLTRVFDSTYYITTTYQYNADGLRSYKNAGGLHVYYYWVDGHLIAQRIGPKYTIFLYDENGTPYGFVYNNAYYYYVQNAQGDIIGILDANGNKIVEYTYSAWGEVLSVTGSHANTIGQDNPLRYRGYYYDDETGFYYVSSRYYDPAIGRWISPEPNVDYGEFDEGAGLLSYNVYAYCANNPVNNFDPDGEAVANIVGGVIGGVTGAALGALLAKELGLSGWKKALFIAGVTAAGAALGAFLGPYMAKLGGKIASMTKSVASSFKATVQSARTAIKHSKAVTKLINNASKLKRSKTVMSHLSSRPYTNSTLTIQNIMKAGKPMADSSLKNGLKWVVNGTYNGSSGVWELVVDTTTNTIVHFLFRSK